VIAGSVQENGTSRTLMLSMTPYQPYSPKERAPTATRALIENVDRWRFRYFAQPQDPEQSGWTDAWEPTDRLPDLVELQITSREPGIGTLPPVRVELKLLPQS
jgi:hypothetical protein